METFAKGSTYHGGYFDGARHGWGVCRYYNGDYYEGEWRAGLRHGRGMQLCTDSSTYVRAHIPVLHDRRVYDGTTKLTTMSEPQLVAKTDTEC